jgi:hypothetical protein
MPHARARVVQAALVEERRQHGADALWPCLEEGGIAHHALEELQLHGRVRKGRHLRVNEVLHRLAERVERRVGVRRHGAFCSLGLGSLAGRQHHKGRRNDAWQARE